MWVGWGVGRSRSKHCLCDIPMTTSQLLHLRASLRLSEASETEKKIQNVTISALVGHICVHNSTSAERKFLYSKMQHNMEDLCYPDLPESGYAVLSHLQTSFPGLEGLSVPAKASLAQPMQS